MFISCKIESLNYFLKRREKIQKFFTACPEVMNWLDNHGAATGDRSSRPDLLCKKVFLEILQNSQQGTCASVSFLNKAVGLRQATLLKKRDQGGAAHNTQVFFCEFCDISKNTFFYKTPLVAASEVMKLAWINVWHAPNFEAMIKGLQPAWDLIFCKLSVVP